MNLLATLERLFFILDSPLGFDEFFPTMVFFLFLFPFPVKSTLPLDSSMEEAIPESLV
jgi:hypothetical protein